MRTLPVEAKTAPGTFGVECAEARYTGTARAVS